MEEFNRTSPEVFSYITSGIYSDITFPLEDSGHINIVSNYNISNNSNITVDYEYYQNISFIADVVTYIIICIGLPLTLVAIYALHSLVKNDQVAPIYVINLLISDILQLCSMIVEVVRPENQTIHDAFSYIHLCGLVASVGFMVCVALERYLVVACPLWYRVKRTIMNSVAVCVLVWALGLVLILSLYFRFSSRVVRILFSIVFFLPLPLFIFSLVGTIRALSTTVSVHSDEKRRIVGLLVLVLLIYTALFVPTIIWYLLQRSIIYYTFHQLSFLCLKLNPLADLTLYIFMRKGAIDKVLVSVCCCEMKSDEISSSS